MEASAALGASIVARNVGGMGVDVTAGYDITFLNPIHRCDTPTEEEFDNQYSDLAHYGRVRFWDTRYST